MSTDRHAEIVDATETMGRVHADWMESDSELFPRALEDAITDAIQVVLHGGDFPTSVIELIQPYVKLAEAWVDVLDDCNRVRDLSAAVSRRPAAVRIRESFTTDPGSFPSCSIRSA